MRRKLYSRAKNMSKMRRPLDLMGGENRSSLRLEKEKIMLTYCPRCKTALSIEEYEASESCPNCGYNFSIMSYVVVTLFSLLLGACPWFFIQQFPREQWGIAYGLSAGMAAFWLLNVIGDIVMRRSGVPRALRRRILPWIGVIVAVIVGGVIAKFPVS